MLLTLLKPLLKTMNFFETWFARARMEFAKFRTQFNSKRLCHFKGIRFYPVWRLYAGMQ